MTIAPKTTSEEVFEEINGFLSRTTAYVAPTDFEFRRLERKAQQLISADAAEGHCALASIYQTTGDRARTLRESDLAIQLGKNKASYRVSKSAVLCNLGYFSEAQSDYEYGAHPERGEMTKNWQRGYLCASFRTMKSFLAKARKMELDLTGLDVDTAARAANVLEKSGVSDKDVARVLDVAGGVLRAHKLFFVGTAPDLQVVDSIGLEHFIEFAFDVDVPSKEAHELYNEFVDQVIQNVAAAPSIVSVSFRTWKRQHERNAA